VIFTSSTEKFARAEWIRNTHELPVWTGAEWNLNDGFSLEYQTANMSEPIGQRAAIDFDIAIF
jgi:hypothetical protein